MVHDHGLGSWLAKRSVRSPLKIALRDGGVAVTYRQLAESADRVTALLAHLGVQPGDRVAFLGANSLAFLRTLFGTVQRGAVFVPINTRLSSAEIDHILQDCGAHVLVYDALHAQHGIGGARSVRHIVAVDSLDDPPPGSAPVEPPSRVVGLEDPAAILYTSGTTGQAKGAVLTHGNLTWAALNAIVDYDVVSTDVALMISPLFHAASLGMGALPIILKGGTLVLERRFDAGAALELIESHRVSMLSGVPTTFQMICDDPNWALTDLSSIRTLTCGGSAVPRHVLAAYEARGLSFSQGYGMTETSPGATSLPAERTRDKPGSVGVPHFFTDVRIAGPDGRGAPAGLPGEIEVSGPNVFAGYYGLSEATAATFTQDGWFRSGDIGHVDDDGYLYISGRIKDLIISGGENVYPAEIETIVAEMAGVSGAAVIGVPDPRWGEVPWLIVTVRPGAVVDLEAVRAHVGGRLARFKVPAKLVVVDELPRTASGKVRKVALRERFSPSDV